MQHRTSRLSSVLGAIYDAKDSLSAEQVHGILKRQDDEAGISAVYRDLMKMVSKGLISEVSRNGAGCYAKHPFSDAFFACERFGNMFGIDVPITDQGRLSGEIGTKVLKRKMRFEGICGECERCI